MSNMCVASVGSVARTPMSFADNINNPLGQYLNLRNSICSGDECLMARKGNLLYRDRNRLNTNRSRDIEYGLHAEYHFTRNLHIKFIGYYFLYS